MWDAGGIRHAEVASPRSMRLPRVLSLYYIAGTLLFAAVDWVLSAPIRAAFLGRPSQRWIYYALLIGLGVLCRARPTWAPMVGMLESAANLTLVLLSIMLPIYALTGTVEAGGPAGLPFTSWTFANVLLTGSVLIFTFHRSQRALLRQAKRRASRSGEPPPSTGPGP